MKEIGREVEREREARSIAIQKSYLGKRPF